MQTRPESVLAYQEAFKALLDAWEEVPEDWRIIMIPPPSFLLLSQCKVDDFNTAAEARERVLAEGDSQGGGA